MMHSKYLAICFFVVCSASAMDEMDRPLSAVEIHARKVEQVRLQKALQQARESGDHEKAENLQAQIASLTGELNNLKTSHHEVLHKGE